MSQGSCKERKERIIHLIWFWYSDIADCLYSKLNLLVWFRNRRWASSECTVLKNLF